MKKQKKNKASCRMKTQHVCFWCGELSGKTTSYKEDLSKRVWGCWPPPKHAVVTDLPCKKCEEKAIAGEMRIRGLIMPTQEILETLLIPGTTLLDLKDKPAEIYNRLHHHIMLIPCAVWESLTERETQSTRFSVVPVDKLVEMGLEIFGQPE